MRIAIIGDLQFGGGAYDSVAEQMKRVALLRPDFAVSMGDAAGPRIHTRGGLEDTKALMDLLGCPYAAVLGNHDVEFQPGHGGEYDPIAAYREIFGCEPWRAIEACGALLLFISVEPQNAERMRTANGVSVTDLQFQWIEDQLRARPGMPTLIFSHAPAAGNGMRCSPPLHSAATDTYLDQTFDALRWRTLQREFPQIRVWFSAHYHMGHDYDSAITEREGVFHVSCGVFAPCSRDQSRHTRFAELSDDGRLVISTFDHDLAQVVLTEDAAIDLTGREAPRGRIAHPRDNEMLIGPEEVLRVMYLESRDRYYIATSKGRLWEYLPELAEFSGTIVLDGGCSELRADRDRLYVTTGDGGIFSVELDSDDRLERIGSFTAQDRRTESEMHGEVLPDVPYETRDTKEGLYVRFD